MAQPTNTYDTYDLVGEREDLSDEINNVSPTDTPFYSSVEKNTSNAVYHEWQTDSLRAAAPNAHIEGDDTTATARTPTVRLGNYTQIFKDAVTVTGTADEVDTAGRANEMDYQLVKTGRELRLDVEKALLDNNARVAGNSTTARELAGVPAWLTTNTSAGTSGSDATGDGTDARTDGTQRNFTQTLMDANLQSIWTNSNSDASLAVMLSAFQMTKALGFMGNNNQRSNVPADRAIVANNIEVYMTPWGEVNCVMSRQMRARDVLTLNLDYWKVSVLRDFRTDPLAKTGDSEKRQVLAEMTLEACAEAASGGVFDLTTS